MTRILVVDDEPQLVRALAVNFRARHYDVVTASTGVEALRAAAATPPDLVVLDLGLPDLDGVEVIAGLRGWSSAPIIVLSGRAGSSDKVDALDAGADDYVTKPFAIDELLARLRALSRRGTPTDNPVHVRIGEVDVDLAAKMALRGSAAAAEGSGGSGGSGGSVEQVRLTPTEWHLLEILVRNPGRLVTQRELLTQVWGPAYVKESGYLRVYLAQLRRKLESDPTRPRHLITEAGIGYRYQP